MRRATKGRRRRLSILQALLPPITGPPWFRRAVGRSTYGAASTALDAELQYARDFHRKCHPVGIKSLSANEMWPIYGAILVTGCSTDCLRHRWRKSQSPWWVYIFLDSCRWEWMAVIRSSRRLLGSFIYSHGSSQRIDGADADADWRGFRSHDGRFHYRR